MKKNTLLIEHALVRKIKLKMIFVFAFAISIQGGQMNLDQLPRDTEDHFPLIQLPAGFKIDKVADKLDRPTSVTWDDEGNMYILTGGGDLFPVQKTKMSIIELKADGAKVEIADLSKQGIQPALVSMIWHKGWFYFTHRAEDLTGAVSRVNKEGEIELLFSGIIDNQAEHQINDIQVGPDGMMYVSVGPAGNSGVADLSIAPWVKRSPGVHARPCQDIVLVGRNYLGPDFRTEDKDDRVLTGAFVPFGVETSPGQVIRGVKLCGGSILRFDPENAINTISTYAWGFRNLLGLTWDSKGNMYAAENGYDIRGFRPVKDDMDASLRINEGKWYGVPDFSANREPLTNPRFEAPDSLQAEVFIGGNSIGKELGFVIDHEASGLTPPDPSVVLGKHAFNSSPSMLDVAPGTWGNWADQVFIAEWGDLSPPTNPLLDSPKGYRVVRVDPSTGEVKSFAENKGGGPASKGGLTGEGLERPFDVKFGPDGAMYIVDYGEVKINLSMTPPYDYQKNTGAVWKVTMARSEEVSTNFGALDAEGASIKNLVTEELPVPDVAALQTPSERIGEYVESNGARIFYEAAGEGPPMLLLHGYPLSGALFARVRDALQNDYTVITLDHRGYGLSEAPGLPHSIEVYASDALAVLDHLGIDQAIIGGMSMGGPITLSMYQTAPERFTGMILIDTSAGAAAPPEAGLWRGVEEVVAKHGLGPVIKALLPDMLTGETRLMAPAVSEYLREIMQGATVEAGRGGALALAQRQDFTSLLGKIEVPTLIIVGTEDSLYPIQVARSMHEQVANSSLAIVPGGAHATIFEAPGRAAAAILEWAKNF